MADGLHSTVETGNLGVCHIGGLFFGSATGGRKKKTREGVSSVQGTEPLPLA